MLNLKFCHPCGYRQRPCHGACACSIDGLDIIQHAKANYCPHPKGAKFGAGEKPTGWTTRSSLPVVELTDEEVEEERRRLKAGGCCGTPSESA